MLIVAVVTAIALCSGAIAWWVLERWSPDPGAPHVAPAAVEGQVRAHPGLRHWLRHHMEPGVLTGAMLASAMVVFVAGLAGVALLLLMVRTKRGFADFDLGAARWGAARATAGSTRVLRAITQFGGAVVIVPLTTVFGIVLAVRQRTWRAIIGFLVVCVGGQFLVDNLIKAVVHRTRPDVARLTGFSGYSFPSGHATAAAATFAAMALLIGRGHSRQVRALLGAGAVGLTTMIGASRVLLGVHWLTDVMAGMCLGWAWFALSSIAFGGRLLHFGEPAQVADAAAEAAAAQSDVSVSRRPKQRLG